MKSVKHLLVTLAIAASTLLGFAQNTFPTIGNVGIGITNPDKPLSILGDEIAINCSGYGGGKIQFYDGGNLGFRVRSEAGGGWRWQFVDGSNREYFNVDYPTGDTHVYGNMIVGANSPAAPLSVRVIDNDSLVVYGLKNNCIGLQTLLDAGELSTYGRYGGGENRLVLQPIVGNVGIGTTDLGGKLTISGDEGDTRSVMIDSREIKFRGDGVAHISIFGPTAGKLRA